MVKKNHSTKKAPTTTFSTVATISNTANKANKTNKNVLKKPSEKLFMKTKRLTQPAVPFSSTAMSSSITKLLDIASLKLNHIKKDVNLAKTQNKIIKESLESTERSQVMFGIVFPKFSYLWVNWSQILLDILAETL